MKLSAILCVFAATLSFALPINDEVETSPASVLLEARDKRCKAVARGGTVATRATDVYMQHCSAMGKITPDQPTNVLHHITQQECANLCVCDEPPNQCRSFMWRPTNESGSRGTCKLYPEHLQRMHYTPGTSGKGQTFWDRTCYHRGKPSPTGPVHTGTPTKPASFKERREEVDDYIVGAMAAGL